MYQSRHGDHFQNMMPRYLTKSRFKMALECPTKLHYTGKREFINARNEDAFMQALADGGFQVGELAKLAYPGGIEVTAKNHAEALRHTDELLARDDVTIFEAAVRHGDLFIRIDVLRKRGQHLDVIEVKAKSYDADEGYTDQSGQIKSAMLPYLRDLAFQVFVVRAAFPLYTVGSFLMMANKRARATVDQLNQRFKIGRQNGEQRVTIAGGTDSTTIGAPLLACQAVDDLVDNIIAAPLRFPGGESSFAATVAHFASAYATDARIPPKLGSHCGKCEFRTPMPDPRSGFHTCWKEGAEWRDADFGNGTVLELWNFRRKDVLIGEGVFGLDQVTQAHLSPKAGTGRLNAGQRQWMQVSGQWPGGGPYFLDRAGLQAASAGWQYPLHFIDFETSRTAIPFHIGRRPYEQVAFQFSHHVMQANGAVRHVSQFLDARPGVFPNYAFVRELERQLSGDEGTILRWATHENSVLRDIWQQLEEDPAPPADKARLQTFILEITSDGERTGRRSMIDLCKLAEHYYFHPLTKGSCSIKKVLPAVLHASAALRIKYAPADYGSTRGITSLNFANWSWWRTRPDGAGPRDPYTLLPPVFDGLDPQFAGEVDGDAELANGGAAMHAYARLQFEDLGQTERQRLEQALLKYCELDTLAMVMIWEAWRADLALPAGSR